MLKVKLYSGALNETSELAYRSFTFPGGESTYKDSQFSAGEIVQINHHPHLELVQVPDKPEQTGEK